jgi:hypothetical protein
MIRNWQVDPVSDAPDVHVLPAEDGEPARGHEPRVGCLACSPRLISDGPFEMTGGHVWAHIEPSWPGASRGYLQ